MTLYVRSAGAVQICCRWSSDVSWGTGAAGKGRGSVTKLLTKPYRNIPLLALDYTEWKSSKKLKLFFKNILKVVKLFLVGNVHIPVMCVINRSVIKAVLRNINIYIM
jgi:hypothetical protein